jgi:nascent polypeptide-associated complex subunit alpha
VQNTWWKRFIMHRRVNPREQRRMMQRMGMNMDSVPDVEQVIIRTGSKEITIEQPEVAILEMQGQKIFQVIGGKITEGTPERVAPSTPRLVVSEADVQLVADQTGKSVEEARKALEECEGDLAKAILLLQS